MAVTYGFYDSLNHDRIYNAQQMSAIFDGIINDGVFMSVGNQFHTVAGTGMQVIVKSGRAWFDSTWTLNDAEYPLSIDAADVLLTRIDAVVLEVNSEVATRANTIKIVKGTPASTPAKPTLTNTAAVHQHALAYVTVAKNTTAITNSMIEIVVGKTETPYVTAILQTTDITDLYNQWEDYFQTWFDTVRGTLDGDVALNLQNQITSLRRDTLKNTTPPIIGLSSSATPDDMFQALAKTGDLHVWRKTVTTTQEIPAGYTLGDVVTGSFFLGVVNSGNKKRIYKYATSPKVGDNGTVYIDSTNTITFGRNGESFSTIVNTLPGKFVIGTATDGLDMTEPFTVVFYIPSDAQITDPTKTGYAYVDKYQPVTGYAKVPAGTTATCPVSTNPNAYQEGSDAKPAGYTLGDVVTGIFRVNAVYYGTTIRYSNSVSVENNGVVTLVDESEYYLEAEEDSYNNAKNLAGKFIIAVCDHNYCRIPKGVVLFIPTNAVISFRQDVPGDEGYGIFIDRYQPVTGYAATPAGTSIEYLGKLGDKARVQVVSYVGTGTYGSSNPNSLTFDFAPKMVTIMDYEALNAAIIMQGQTKYASSITGSNYNGSCNMNGKTLTYYNTKGPSYQLNSTGAKYLVIAIG